MPVHIVALAVLIRFAHHRSVPATITLSKLAALLATPARARMLEALGAGEPVSATELALVAEVQPQTASSHLLRLVEAGVVEFERQGRHRLYRLSNPRVADLLESFSEVDPNDDPDNYRAHPRIAHARTCYDHLAGWLGSSLTASMLARGHMHVRDKDFVLQADGERFLVALGVDVAAARARRRLFARCCLDWTENRPHLGGALGAAVAGRCFEKRWITQREGDRCVELTVTGRKIFAQHFGVEDEA
jgi:DNA-binding transcriptional ArsR family regulator